MFGLSKNNFLLPNVPNEFKDLNEVRALMVNYNNALKAIINSLIADVDFSFEKQNGTIRLLQSFTNFLSNSGVESWSAGTNVAPDNWWVWNASVARSADVASGSYSAEVTFNTATAGAHLAASIGSFGRYGRYTYSFYYKCISGTGSAIGCIRQNEGSYDVIASQLLDNTIDDIWKLCIIHTEIPVAYWGDNSAFGIYANDAVDSIWLVDEFTVHEGFIACAWTPAPIWDSGAGQYLLQPLWPVYDIQFNSNGVGPVLKSPDGSNWRITIDNTGTLITTKI